MGPSKRSSVFVALVTLCLVCSVLFISPATAHLREDLLQVEPPQPEAGDLVAVTAFGWLPDGCWDDSVTYDCLRVGSSIEIRFHTVDHWMPGNACVTVVTEFEGRCELGALAAGTYTVHVVEERQSLRFPLPAVADFELVVNGPVATEGKRWSTLKAWYVGGVED